MLARVIASPSQTMGECFLGDTEEMGDWVMEIASLYSTQLW